MIGSSFSFTKMHGLGNDFVVIDTIKNKINLSTNTIKYIADRHLGIGCDQLLLIEPSTCADFFCRIFNADGSEAKQCGNGLRCIARYIHEEKLHSSNSFQLETHAGVFPVLVNDYEHIRLTMNIPCVQEKLLALDQSALNISIIALGNPHAILKISSFDVIDVAATAMQIAANPLFKTEGVNVGLMQIISPHHIRLRTYERGSGETLSCGSNSCAAVVAGISNAWLAEKVEVECMLGSLFIEWQGSEHPVHLIGPASKVYSGRMT